MICRAEAPMDWDASITPTSTSLREPSTSRATKGAAEMVRGTMTAVGPRVVPRSQRVNGRTAINKMINGNERVRLTITSNILYRTGWGRIPSAAHHDEQHTQRQSDDIREESGPQRHIQGFTDALQQHLQRGFIPHFRSPPLRSGPAYADTAASYPRGIRLRAVG